MKAVILYFDDWSDFLQEQYLINEFNKKENDIYIVCDENIPIDNEQDIFHILKGKFMNRVQAYKYACTNLREKYQKYEAAVFCDNSFFGPFVSIDKILRRMKDKGAVNWSISRYYDRFDENYNEKEGHADTSFLYVERDSKDRVIEFLQQVENERIEELEEAEILLEKILPNLDTYIDYTELGSQHRLNNIEWLERVPYYMINDYECPIIKKESFIKNDYRFTNAKEIMKAIEYVRTNTDYDVNIIWNYLLTHFDVTYLIDMLQLRYVISDSAVEQQKCNLDSCAIIMHITYEKIVERAFQYICNIPKEIDVFITTKGEKCVEKIKQNVSRLGRRNCKVLIANEKGRDISALLISCKEVINKYKYVCFVHDQKTRNGLGPSIIGENNMWDRWDNVMKNETYIRNIIEIFEREDRLGLIMPPIIYYGGMFATYAAPWTMNYEMTKNLAKRLKVDVPFGEYTYSNGTTFWCKTKALKKLFDGGITLDDFAPEPMMSDGTISHAVERIFPYIAQDAGYYTAIAECTEYATRHIGDLDYMLRGLIKRIEYPTGGYYFKFAEQFDLVKLDSFIKKYKKIYIYGYGKVARKIGKILEKRNWLYEAYVISDDKHISATKERIIHYSEISQDKQEIGIIVGLAGYNQREVVPQLIQDGYKNIFIV